MEAVVIEPEGEGERGMEVRGELRPELANLQGARVRVRGKLREARYLFVSDYEILEIAGGVPLVGTLRWDAGRFVLETRGEAVTLDGAPDGFKELSGSKIWVLIDESGAVGGYGVIRKR